MLRTVWVRSAVFMSRNIDTHPTNVKCARQDFTIQFRELRALLKTGLEVVADLDHRGAGEGSRPSLPVAPDGPDSDLAEAIAILWPFTSQSVTAPVPRRALITVLEAAARV